MRLTTIGRRTGGERGVVVGYFMDGPNLVTMAMNGWGEGEAAWWLNLQAHPDVEVEPVDGPRFVTGRAAEGGERARLWACWGEIDKTWTRMQPFDPRKPPSSSWNHSLRPMTRRSHRERTNPPPHSEASTRDAAAKGWMVACEKGYDNGFG